MPAPQLDLLAVDDFKTIQDLVDGPPVPGKDGKNFSKYACVEYLLLQVGVWSHLVHLMS